MTNLSHIDAVNLALSKMQGLPAAVSEFGDDNLPDATMMAYLTNNAAIWETEPAVASIDGSKEGCHKGVFLEPVYPSGGTCPFVAIVYVSPSIYARITEAQKGMGQSVVAQS